MKKISLLLLQSLLFIGVSFGQSNGHGHNELLPCGITNHIEELKNSDPQIRLQMEQSAEELRLFTENYIANEYDPNNRVGPYIIPVVFHVLHMNGPENISDEQIFDAMDRMNEDFNKLNNNWSAVQSEFLGRVADIEVQFELAKKKPDGSCFKGITRTFSQTSFSGSGTQQRQAVQNEHGNFAGNRYMNIFVVADAGGAAGYTNYPNFNTSMSNGIWILHNYVGRIGTSNNGVSTALSHEVGHWLNLPHLWGNSNNPGLAGNCSGDDGVTDTPNTIGWTSCNLQGNSCDGLLIEIPFDELDETASITLSDLQSGRVTAINSHGLTGLVIQRNGGTVTVPFDVRFNDEITLTFNAASANGNVVFEGQSKDNVENFMEYSYCSKMFTEGQKARMHAALNSTTGGRNNVWSAGNLSFTGVSDPEVFCKADFRTQFQEVCVGTPVNFIDESFFNVTNWTWTFEGGNPANSNNQNPQVVYNTPGRYKVTLTAGDGTSSQTIEKEDYIIVLPSQDFLPFAEGFEYYEDIASSNGIWTVNNPGNNNTWEVFNGAGHTGNKSVRISNIGQPAGGIDELLSSTLDLSSLPSSTSITLTFRYSFKQRNTNNTDRLRVFASSDCGETWATRRQLLSSAMSLGVQTENWIPEGPQDWVTNHVTNITSAYFVNGMRFKFEWENGGGNNIYLDDINLYSGSDPLSINNQDEILSNVVLFPNPSIDELIVRLSIQDALNFDVKVRDLSGKELQSFHIYGQQGVNDVMINVSDLAKGMYMVEIVSATGKTVKQFIKQ